jgi:predicted ATPase/class 3 adenylate cyclase
VKNPTDDSGAANLSVRRDLPEGTVTLLLTDIEGSTRTLHRLGEVRYADALADHRDIIRAATAEHNGVEVDTQGDAFFIVFSRTIDGVNAAVAMQRGLAKHPWLEGGEIKVRLGLHTGEPQRTDEGYVGMDLHAAARIASSGHGGQVLLSERAAQESADSLADDVTLRDLGRLNLKDLDEPEHVYQLVISDLPSDFPPPRTLQTQPNNLPTSLTPFVGRARMVAQLRDMLLEPTTRAVTLLGPGGVGKSRLALRVATELLHSMDDGAFFVGLAPIHDPELVLPEIAKSLSIRESQDSNLIDTVIENLKDKALLLLLDNFEQVPEAARDIAKLLAGCPGLKILTTSRQPLRLSGEKRFPVTPFELPKPEERLTTEQIANLEVVRLFIDRARAVLWDFELMEDNAHDVLDICRKVDGLPLCIELAVAKLYDMSVAQLNAALNDRLATLDDGSFDLLDHQRTLRDLIGWSYESLTDDERLLFRSLGIFAGGATKTAAAEVCAGEIDSRQFEKHLESLSFRNLIKLEFTGGGGAQKVVSQGEEDRRIVLLETLRAFALDELSESAELIDLQDKHLDWYAKFAGEAEDKLRGAMRDGWMMRLDPEQANFRAAFDRAMNRDVAEALRLGSSLWFYWYQRGNFSEGGSRLEAALAADPGSDPAARATALLASANLDRYRGRADQAEQAADEALALFQQLDDEQGIANSLTQLGAIYEHQGNYEKAIDTLEEAQQLLRGLGSNERLSFALVALGAMKQIRGDIDSAEAHYEESLTLSRAREDHNAMLSALINLGEVAQLKNNETRAHELLLESLEIARQLGLKIAIAYCLEVLAALTLSEPELAARMFGNAEQIREDISAPVETWNQERYERDVQTLRELLGEETLSIQWAAGRSLPLDGILDNLNP